MFRTLCFLVSFACAFSAASYADDSACSVKQQFKSCFSPKVVASVSGDLTVPPEFPKSVCITSLCLKDKVIVLEGDTFSGPFVTKVTQATDHDGDTIYGKLNYEAQLFDKVKFTNRHRVQCPNDSNPKCWWYEYDTYRSASLSIRLSTYNGKIVSFELDGLFYGLDKDSEDKTTVLPIKYQ